MAKATKESEQAEKEKAAAIEKAKAEQAEKEKACSIDLCGAKQLIKLELARKPNSKTIEVATAVLIELGGSDLVDPVIINTFLPGQGGKVHVSADELKKLIAEE